MAAILGWLSWLFLESCGPATPVLIPLVLFIVIMLVLSLMALARQWREYNDPDA